MEPKFRTNVGGSRNPEPGGGAYYGTISGFNNGKPLVNVPMLGFVSQPCNFMNSYRNDPYTTGERVVVMFLDHGKQELVVLGRVNHQNTVFPTYAQYLAAIERIEALETTVGTLETTVDSLQAQIDALDASKADATHSHE